MNKILLYLLCSLLISEACIAQQPTFSLGESNATADFIPQEMLGETKTEYLVLSWVFGLTLSSA